MRNNIFLRIKVYAYFLEQPLLCCHLNNLKQKVQHYLCNVLSYFIDLKIGFNAQKLSLFSKFKCRVWTFFSKGCSAFAHTYVLQSWIQINLKFVYTSVLQKNLKSSFASILYRIDEIVLNDFESF